MPTMMHPGANKTSLKYHTDHRPLLRTDFKPSKPSKPIERIFICTKWRPNRVLQVAAQTLPSGIPVTLLVTEAQDAPLVDTDHPDLDVIAVKRKDDTPGGWIADHPLAQLQKGYVPDTADKRNAAQELAISHYGVSRIVVMDDDIVLNDMTLELMASGLDQADLASCIATGLEDNSPTGYAARTLGLEQTSFVGGGCLAINLDRTWLYFPPEVYGEDWAAVEGAVRTRSVVSVGSVRQHKNLWYVPDADIERALVYEPMDAYFEGRIASLHHSDAHPLTDEQYWDEFLSLRQNFLDTLLEQTLLKSKEGKLEQERALEVGSVVLAAKRKLREVTPELCANYSASLDQARIEWDAARIQVEKGKNLHEFRQYGKNHFVNKELLQNKYLRDLDLSYLDPVQAVDSILTLAIQNIWKKQRRSNSPVISDFFTHIDREGSRRLSDFLRERNQDSFHETLRLAGIKTWLATSAPITPKNGLNNDPHALESLTDLLEDVSHASRNAGLGKGDEALMRTAMIVLFLDQGHVKALLDQTKTHVLPMAIDTKPQNLQPRFMDYPEADVADRNHSGAGHNPTFKMGELRAKVTDESKKASVATLRSVVRWNFEQAAALFQQIHPKYSQSELSILRSFALSASSWNDPMSSVPRREQRRAIMATILKGEHKKAAEMTVRFAMIDPPAFWGTPLGVAQQAGVLAPDMTLARAQASPLSLEASTSSDSSTAQAS